MQINEHVEQVKNGKRLPTRKPARNATRATGAGLVQPSADDSQPNPRTTGKPGHYGSGF